MKIRIFYSLLFLSCFLSQFSNNATAQNPTFVRSLDTVRPKLVVGIVVDQMRYDYLTRFANKFGSGGFNRLINEGYNCTQNYLNYVPSNTAPGHASIYTGTTPSEHGIINNYWYDSALKNVVYSVADYDYDAVGTKARTEKYSPKRLLAETLTDAFKRQVASHGKVISIALKHRSAILPGGLKADAAYWFRGQKQGAWISSSYYMSWVPKWVLDYNDDHQAESYLKTWSTFYPIDDYTESAADERPQSERGFRGQNSTSFPYDLEKLAALNGGYDILQSSPFGNSYTFDFALEAIDKEKLGKDKATDFLLVSLSSTDFIGHNFGVNSKEVQDVYVRLDRDIEDFLEELDDQIGAGNYTLFLTSDHGAVASTVFLEENGEEAGIFKEATFKLELKYHALKTFGTEKVIEFIQNEQIYLDNAILDSLNLKTEAVADSLKHYMLNYPKVKAVLTRADLAKSFFTPEEQLIKNGYHPNRSGHLFYVRDPKFVVYSKTGSDHGSPYEFDTHTPLIFYGFGVNHGETNQKTEVVDIVTTLASLLKIKPPENATGKVLIDILK